MSESILDNLQAARRGMAQNLAELDTFIERLEGQSSGRAKEVTPARKAKPAARGPSPTSTASVLRRAVPKILNESPMPLQPAEVRNQLAEQGIDVNKPYLRAWLSVERREKRLARDENGYTVEKQTALFSKSENEAVT